MLWKSSASIDVYEYTQMAMDIHGQPLIPMENLSEFMGLCGYLWDSWLAGWLAGWLATTTFVPQNTNHKIRATANQQ